MTLLQIASLSVVEAVVVTALTVTVRENWTRIKEAFRGR